MHELQKNEVIKRAIVGLFLGGKLDTDEILPSELIIGGYDPNKYVIDGVNGLNWMSLTLANQWQTDITDAYFGELKLFKHSFKWLELNAGFSGFGLTTEDFQIVAKEIQKADMTDSVVCSENECFGKLACSEYAQNLPKFKFTISNKFEYEVGSDKLLKDISTTIVDEKVNENEG